MTAAGLKTVAKKCVVLVFSLVCAFCLFRLAGLFTLSCQAGEGIAPDRTISVVASDSTTPEWKIIWDKARHHTRRDAFGQAASLYSTLFQLKPNIEEANWEYCKVLLKIDDYAGVKKILPSLLEKAPGRSEYLFAAGQLAAYEKEWTLAATYYGKVLEKDPAGELADAALEGLADSLKAQGKRAAAFTLLEQLIVRKPRRMDLLQEAAQTAQQLGYTQKARKLYERLLTAEKVDDRVIFAAANAFDAPGYEQKSSLLWAEYLKGHPDYLPFRRKLIDYHLQAGNYQEAIPHITYLADHLDKNDEYLLKAGTVNLHQLRRPDKALGYLERYLMQHPDDMAVKRQVVDIQAVLARELLAIVENDGADLLWKDLTEVTANRAAIYLAMADLLERKGSDKSLLEVLTILHHDSPDNDTLSWRIASQYYRGEQYRQAFDFLQKVHNKETKTKAYYVMRGKTEEILGMEMAALTSFEDALAIDPDDYKLRRSCLELAGKIGLVDRMTALFTQGTKSNGHPDDGLLLTYLDQLSRNFLFRQYDRVRDRHTVLFGADRRLGDRLDLMKANALRREGKNRGAEQLLRRMLAEERSVKEVLFALTDNAIADRNLHAAEIWYQALVQRSVGQGSEFSPDEEGARRLLRRARILKTSGEYEQARELIRSYQKERQQGNSASLSRLAEELEKERCWLTYYMGEYQEALQAVQSLASGKQFDRDLYILSRLLVHKLNASATGKELETRLLVNDHPSLTRIVDVIDLEFVHEQYDLVERHLRTVLKNCPGSVSGNVFSVRLYLAQGKFEEAVELSTKLTEDFPEEPYFTKILMEVEVKRGRYDRGLAVFEKWKNLPDLDTFMTEESSSLDIEETLILARLLWGNKQQEKALKVYERLLAPTVLEILQEAFSQQQINYLYLNREKSLWNSLMLMLQSEPELVAELMEPEFLVNNLSNAAGGIVAAHYELYSWQKMIANEYQARKAIFERNYSSAEQSYKRLLDEEKTAEGMIDLAAVYGRTGKYRKEAQVYEALQNTGATSPELVSSLERSSIQMSPQNLFNISYEEKDGRNGFIDLAKLSVGTSFQFTPDLDKDIRLSYSNNRYESINSSESATSNMLYGSADYEFAKDYELSFGGGTEKLDGTSDARFLYDMAVKGQLDEYFNAYLAWQKRFIYDTVTAIKEDISAQGIETGLTCETPVGISFGGDIRHLNYSDGNLQNRFHGFTSYGLYGEDIHLSLRYDYQYLDNNDANPVVGRLALEEQTAQDDAFYWSPESFSEHLLTLHYQHDFLGYQQGKKQGVSYYSIDNAVGSEPDGIVSFTGKFNIFLEMNPHFLLKGNFTFATSDDYEEKGLFLSLHYRWQ